MGLLDLLKPRRETIENARTALAEARDPDADDGAITRLIQSLLNVGLDGKGPVDSAPEVAADALAKTGDDVEAAVGRVVRSHLVGGAVGGFATSVGGFVTMPVALPVNVLEFYVQATRMVGAVATLRGYDVSRPEIRSAVLLTLVGSKADDVLAKAGVATGGGGLTSLAFGKLPPAALMILNKAVGFRLLRGVGEKTLSRLGRGVPLVGGFVGAGVDAYLMRSIADQARKEFPPA